jgi:2-succinyl-5-enolpyruvyl-6-hydroxy-3-cyclohexene-1-carboxylate synthase
MTERDVTTSFATTLVDEWARAGVRFAAVAPGSRNTPLSLALVREERLHVDIVIDERSAAFRALGFARASGEPALVCCTSGTAAANLHPAVIEADHACVPLIVCTADRPPELRDCGAGQTIDQTKLYADAVRWFHDPGPPIDAPEQWRALACRAVDNALGAPPGPVHLNLPFREPLVPTGAPIVVAPGRADGAPWARATRGETRLADADAARLADLVRAHPRGIVVAGWGAHVDAETATRFAAAAGWPLLADPISQLRVPGAISTYEALLRVDSFAREHRPDLVVRVGAPLTSKVAGAWADASVPHVLFDPHRSWLDPQHATAEHVVADADAALGAVTKALGPAPDTAWLEAWCGTDARARVALDAVLDRCDEPIEGRIARDVAAAVPEGGALVVASSLPVRALEWCMSPRRGMRVLANRGANGIDGFVSTAAGIARANPGAPTVALCGDLCFLHDTNGLLALDDDLDLTVVVVDNDGGGIFSYLPQHELPEFEALFATPHGLDLVAVAQAHGVPARRTTDLDALLSDVGPGVRVLVVPVDRSTSVAVHRRLWAAAATAISG